MNQINWEIQKVDIRKLKPAVYNPRKLNRKAKDPFVVSQDKFGRPEPIVVNQDYTIIGGHMRYNLYLEQGEKEIEVSYPSRLLNQEEEKKLNIILNSVSGYTLTGKLLAMGLSVQELQGLGFNELKMPDDKQADKRAEVKSKNPLVYNVYYFPTEFFYIQKQIELMKKKEGLQTQSEAMLFLINYK